MAHVVRLDAAHVRWAALALVWGCASPVAPAVVPAAAETHGLGMSDVSILLPLPRDPHAPVLGTANELIDPAWFDALVVSRHDIAPKNDLPIPFNGFQVVAVRFDLCDRSTIGPCPDGVLGRLRLVLQPLYSAAGETYAHDVALHAFYPIPPGELAPMIDELRGLARLQNAPPDAPLAVSPAALAGNAIYLARLRALVMHHARADNLVRLTVIGQQANSAAFAWIFRGLDRDGASFAAMTIPNIDTEQQTMLVAGGDTVYLADPVADLPSGFALATNGARFAAAVPEQRIVALEALAAIQNPTQHDTGDTQCIACHVANYLTARRAHTAGIDPAAVAGRYQSRHDVTVRSVADRDPRVVRAFGWAATLPVISQRVANDTAQVLSEIEARFPARR